MALNTFEKIALALKFFAMIFGGLAILWGFMLVLGQSPDGPHESIWGHLYGSLILFQGLIYIIPNSRIAGNNKLSLIYLVVTLLMCLIPIIYTFQIILSGGMKYSFELVQIKINVVWLFLLLTAPFSLIFSILGARKGSSEHL